MPAFGKVVFFKGGTTAIQSPFRTADGKVVRIFTTEPLAADAARVKVQGRDPDNNVVAKPEGSFFGIVELGGVLHYLNVPLAPVDLGGLGVYVFTTWFQGVHPAFIDTELYLTNVAAPDGTSIVSDAAVRTAEASIAALSDGDIIAWRGKAWNTNPREVITGMGNLTYFNILGFRTSWGLTDAFQRDRMLTVAGEAFSDDVLSAMKIYSPFLGVDPNDRSNRRSTGGFHDGAILLVPGTPQIAVRSYPMVNFTLTARGTIFEAHFQLESSVDVPAGAELKFQGEIGATGYWGERLEIATSEEIVQGPQQEPTVAAVQNAQWIVSVPMAGLSTDMQFVDDRGVTWDITGLEEISYQITRVNVQRDV